MMKNIFSQGRRIAKNGNRILLWLFTLVLIGCQDLNFTDPNDPTLDNPPSVQKLVTGIEAGMRIDYAIYLRVVEIFGRQVYYLEPADPRYTGELLRGPIDAGGFLLNRPWGSRYRVVKNCAQLLALPAEREVNEAGKRAFANTIIAHQLLLNLNLTYDNGVKIVFSDDVSTPFVSRDASYAEIARLLDSADGDLAIAITQGDDFGFKLSSGFAGFNKPSTFRQFNRALRARVAVYQKDYNAALTALGNSFLNTGASLQVGVYHVYSAGANDQVNETWEDPSAESIRLVAHPSFRAEAAPGDTRFSTKTVVRDTIFFDNLSSNLAVNILASSTDRLPLIRNEELILLRAEANIGLNQLGAAEADINQFIRQPAGLGAITLTPANALDQLLYEKRYSLFMEGHRWIDVRRYDKLGTLPLDRGGDIRVPFTPRPESEVTGG